MGFNVIVGGYFSIKRVSHPMIIVVHYRHHLSSSSDLAITHDPSPSPQVMESIPMNVWLKEGLKPNDGHDNGGKRDG